MSKQESKRVTLTADDLANIFESLSTREEEITKALTVDYGDNNIIFELVADLKSIKSTQDKIAKHL